MSIPNPKKLKRRPTHPGEILREDFMPEYELSVTKLASSLGVSRQTVNDLLRERRANYSGTLQSSGLTSNAPWISGTRNKPSATM